MLVPLPVRAPATASVPTVPLPSTLKLAPTCWALWLRMKPVPLAVTSCCQPVPV